MQLVALKPIIMHDPDNALFGQIVPAGASFEIGDRQANILIRDGEANAIGHAVEEPNADEPVEDQ